MEPKGSLPCSQEPSHSATALMIDETISAYSSSYYSVVKIMKESVEMLKNVQ
jgi:hypothetical protein